MGSATQRAVDGRTAGWLVGLAAAAVALRWPFLQVPMITDEGAYAYVAHFWSGSYQLYRDIPFDRPQGIFLLYKLALLFGDDIATIRLAAALYNAATCMAVFACADRLFDRPAAWCAAGAYALFSAAPRIEGFTANAELFTLLPLVLSATLVWQGRWVGAGVLAGVATVIKPNGLAGLLLALGWAACAPGRGRAWAQVVAGFCLAPLASAVHGWSVDWWAYWGSFVDRRLLLYSIVSSRVGTQLDNLIAGVRATVSSWILLAVLAAFAAIKRRERATAFALLWLATCFAGMALGGDWQWHYFQQIIPPLCVLAGGGVARWRAPGVRWPWVGAAGLAAVWFARGDLPFWSRSADEISWTLYGRAGYLAAPQAARAIDARTAPSASIYVAFAEAEIYFLAGRKAAVPQFFYRQVLYSPAVFAEVVGALQRGEAEMVVVAQGPPAARMSVEAFVALLEQRYEPVQQFGPLVLLRRRPANERPHAGDR